MGDEPTRKRRPPVSAPKLSHQSELLELASEGAILLDDRFCILAINQAAERILGSSAKSLIGQSLLTHVRSAGADAWRAFTDHIEARERADTLIKTIDGRTILASVRSVQQPANDKPRQFVTLRDADVFDHERRQAMNPKVRQPVFRFASERKLRPDLRRQRQISKPLDAMITLSERAVAQGARLLILGESGVGKTELARHLHDFITDGAAPFVHVNCGSIPETLFEAELFGYERGSFTGALQSGRKGYIEAADGGTLFLDEVGEIPLIMQSRLLKFLESGSVQRIGSTDERSVRVRVISATNRDLEAMVGRSEFRRDLYFRLAVVPVRVRALREAPEIIRDISDYFLTIINQTRLKPLTLTETCRDALAAYAFPGNIRELFNVLQQLSVMVDATADAHDLPAQFQNTSLPFPATPDTTADLKKTVRAYERDIINRAISLYGSKRKAAEALGVDIGTIVRKTQTRH